jgi:Phosphotransferase system IIC components, glucose/maltose/N-acetylglucosamine-specific
MNLKDLAKEIIEKVGGQDNIVSVTHCVTRLRFVLADESIPNDNEIKSIDKVLGVMRAGGQYQVIVGSIVKAVYAEVDSLLKSNANGDDIKEKLDKAKAKNKETLINRLSRSLMKMIFPLVPTMAAVGIMKGCLAIFLMAGVLQPTDGTFIIVQNINDAFLYFLPIIVSFSVAKTFDSNPYVAAAIGASLVFPGLVKMYNDGTPLTFMTIPVTLTVYGNSIFPVMCSTFIAAKFEKYLDKFIPPFLEFFEIIILLLVMVPFTFLVVGPAFVEVSKVLASATMGVYNLFPLATGVIFGAFWQVCVLFGLHYAFIPVLTDITLRTGSNALGPILGMGVWALAGAALGFALKAKQKEKKSTAFSAMTSALFGITEPAIFGIALPYRKPFICAMIAGGIAGPFCTILGVNQFSPATVGGILTFGAHMDPTGNPRSIIGYFTCFFISFIISAVLTYFAMKEKDLA